VYNIYLINWPVFTKNLHGHDAKNVCSKFLLLNSVPSYIYMNLKKHLLLQAEIQKRRPRRRWEDNIKMETEFRCLIESSRRLM
jgi:hypothetical protein